MIAPSHGFTRAMNPARSRSVIVTREDREEEEEEEGEERGCFFLEGNSDCCRLRACLLALLTC
jgi:hypothetical protein